MMTAARRLEQTVRWLRYLMPAQPAEVISRGSLRGVELTLDRMDAQLWALTAEGWTLQQLALESGTRQIVRAAPKTTIGRATPPHLSALFMTFVFVDFGFLRIGVDESTRTLRAVTPEWSEYRERVLDALELVRSLARVGDSRQSAAVSGDFQSAAWRFIEALLEAFPTLSAMKFEEPTA